MVDILLKVDNLLSILKNRNYLIINGVVKLKKSDIYTNVPYMISTFKYRNDIPNKEKANSLLCYFMDDISLFTRIKTIDNDLHILKDYGGVCGFDLSPSICMISFRQRLSILVNSIFNAYLASNGIKILPNSRIGDFSTISALDSIPNNSNFISSFHGCKKYGFKAYGLHQLKIAMRKINPDILFIYGNFSIEEASKIFTKPSLRVFVFPDRKSRVMRNVAVKEIFCDNDSLNEKYFQYDWSYSNGC